MITRHHTTEKLSQIVIHNGIVYLAGQVGEGASMAEQTRDCLAKIDALLAEAGSDKSRILQAIIWLSDLSEAAEMNAVWNEWMPAGHAPARAAGGVALIREGLKVEITVTAAQG